MKSILLILLLAACTPEQKTLPPIESVPVEASEPEYCDPKTFLSLETKFKAKDIDNAHLFKLGKVNLLGVAVGASDTEALVSFAKAYGTAEASKKYCTWYFNSGDIKAQKTFHHIYVSKPDDFDDRKDYLTLKSEFASFASCATDQGYLAMGCNGMKHRGPTVFGMLLAYSGCKPERAAQIVNTIWGLNGIKPEVRLAIIKDAFTMGENNKDIRLNLREAFEGK